MFNKFFFVTLLGCALVLSQVSANEEEKKAEGLFGKIKEKAKALIEEGKNKLEVKKHAVEEGKKKIEAELEVLKKKLDEDLKSIAATAGAKYEEEKQKLTQIYENEKNRLNDLLAIILISIFANLPEQ